MILITVGTTQFPFPRMNLVFENLLKHRINNEQIIFQYGTTQVSTKEKNVRLISSLPFHSLQEYIKKARIIITHGGPATIYQTLAAGKIPYVLPREKKYHEHVNDHQLIFTKEMFHRNKIIMITNQEYIFFNKTKNPSSKKTATISKSLTQYLSSII